MIIAHIDVHVDKGFECDEPKQTISIALITFTIIWFDVPFKIPFSSRQSFFHNEYIWKNTTLSFQPSWNIYIKNNVNLTFKWKYTRQTSLIASNIDESLKGKKKLPQLDHYSA